MAAAWDGAYLETPCNAGNFFYSFCFCIMFLAMPVERKNPYNPTVSQNQVAHIDGKTPDDGSCIIREKLLSGSPCR